MQEIKLSNGKVVLKSDYISVKTKNLIDFGYTTLTEKDVAEQVDKILSNDKNLNVIGAFCKDDISI